MVETIILQIFIYQDPVSFLRTASNQLDKVSMPNIWNGFDLCQKFVSTLLRLYGELLYCNLYSIP